jgi:RND family efflux transporter MFP subunit
MKWRSHILAIFLLTLYISVACERSREMELSHQPPKFPVVVSKAFIGKLKSKIYLTGTVRPIHESNVGPRVSGTIQKVYVNEGDRVKRGDILAIVDRSSLIIARNQAEAALETARASLRRILAGTREEQIQQAEANLFQAKANLENAEVELKRTEGLYLKGIVPKRLYDQVITQHKMALAQYQIAEENLRMSKKGATQEEIDLAKSQVKQSEVALNMAEQQLKDSQIEAPFSGIIAGRYVNEGEIVSAMMPRPLFLLVDIDTVEVEVSIPEERLSEVSVGTPVKVIADALPGEIFYGKIDVIHPIVDPRSRTFKAKIIIPNRPNRLKSGMFCRMEIITKEIPDVLIIPEKAIIEDEGHKAIFLVNGLKVTKRVVKTDRGDGKYIIVKEGLKEGDLVVVEGGYALEEGTGVQILREIPPPEIYREKR